MKKQNMLKRRIHSMHSQNYFNNGKHHEELKEFVDVIIKEKMIYWDNKDFLEVINYLTKMNSRKHNKYFVKSQYIEQIKKEIQSNQMMITQNECWTHKQECEEEIFYLTKILIHLDPQYFNLKFPTDYTQWCEDYKYVIVHDYVISILAHFDSLDCFEEYLQGLLKFVNTKQILSCIRVYRRTTTIQEILEY
jgi:hypothetical protein